MRILGCIFAFYVLFLSFQPGITAMLAYAGPGIEACCGDLCEPLEDSPVQEGEEKENNSCDPSHFCNCCLVYSSGLASENFAIPLEFSQVFLEKKERVPAHIAPDFWQPPKIV